MLLRLYVKTLDREIQLRLDGRYRIVGSIIGANMEIFMSAEIVRLSNFDSSNMRIYL